VIVNICAADSMSLSNKDRPMGLYLLVFTQLFSKIAVFDARRILFIYLFSLLSEHAQ